MYTTNFNTGQTTMRAVIVSKMLIEAWGWGAINLSGRIKEQESWHLR